MDEKKELTPAQKRKREQRRNALVRALVQLLFFITMPGAFVAGFSGVKYVFQWIGNGAILKNNSFITALIGLCVFTILFGRFFCGYICAFGSFGDFIYWLSGIFQTKILHRKKRAAMPRRVLRWGQKIKYLILLCIVILCTLGVYGKLRSCSPWDVFSQLCVLQKPDGYIAGTVLLVFIIIGMAIQERFFCQFLCPMGAVFSLLPVLPTGMLQRNEEKCIKGCKICDSQCPVELKLFHDGSRNGECISCERCMQGCPRKNIGRMEQRIIKNQHALVLLKALLFFAMGVFIGFLRIY